jgi:hypothetical protein
MIENISNLWSSRLLIVPFIHFQLGGSNKKIKLHQTKQSFFTIDFCFEKVKKVLWDQKYITS